ncbi:MAG: D-aminoacyl-tRNA deacylase [Daejeonella sp.]|uniref:D-aminoacyl-tRNA deacylase n=1 Tax=Daejeonella sp. TaxID=2805397 RepID=UPI002733A951|nr:D-aminoacyl-tRNA deacylase [Daejeonella sp.]MDP3469534.1 D-aminoacyl-tRNA deacylase [Daejeonella sp.]
MRAIIQRVSSASCSIEGKISGEIGLGFMILLGIEDSDTEEDLNWLAQKITNMRIFSDEHGLMNKALADVRGNILLVSQFTLFTSTKKGNRPGFTRSAKPDIAIPMYEKMIRELGELSGTRIQTGVFGADMQISLVNDGPVTIIMDSKSRE